MTEQKELIIELYNGTQDYREITQIVNKKFDTDRWDSERVRDVIRKDKKKKNKLETLKVLEKIDKIKEKNIPIKIERNGLLDLADLHIPFQIDGILDIVEKHKDEISTIVLSGDILDCFEISRFKSIYNYPIEKELIEAIKFINQIKKIVGSQVKIVLIFGNHEQRLKSYIARMQQRELCKFLNPRILFMLQRGFVLYENGAETFYEGIEDLIVIDDWFVNFNEQIIICHPNSYSKTDVQNAKMAINYFITHGHKFSAVAVSHTHHQNETFDYMGKYGAEVGCLCKQFDYTSGYTSVRKNINGYGLFKFDSNGKFDVNGSKLYQIDQNSDKKKLNIVKI